MSLLVLKTLEEVVSARKEMRRRNIDCIDRWPIRMLRRWCFFPGVRLGDRLKSWDVLKTVDFLTSHVSPGASVLDLGAYASEILPVLYRLNYRNLTGIDLNQNLVDMPHKDEINYVISDFYTSGFAPASFDAMTAISVIEHGFDKTSLLAEISRLLKPGGYFVASVDYWPAKIDTTGIRAFGLEWIIFSRDDLTSFFDQARKYGLELCGTTDFEAKEPTVKWLGKAYTFAWMAFRKVGSS